MPATRFLRKALGDHSIGKASFTMPAAVFAGLFTANPTDTGSQANEVTGGSYARVSITASMGTFDPVTGIAVLVTDVFFATPTANWGTVTHVGILDAATVGNMLYFQPIPSPRVVLNGGRRVHLKAGLFQIQLI